jgi:HlyD family secretion protein
MKARLILVAAALGIGGVVVWARGGSHETENGPRGSSPVRVVRGTIGRNVSSDGRVVCERDIDLRCRAGGEVLSVPHDSGDPVKKGDLLLELERSTEERAIGQAKAALQAALARLAQARARATLAEGNATSRRSAAEASVRAARVRSSEMSDRSARLRRLLAKELVSGAECEAAESASAQAESELTAAEMRLKEAAAECDALDLYRQEVVLAEAQAESARIDLAGARQRLAEVRIVSPIDGTVTRRSVQAGQVIPSAPPGTAGMLVMTVSDLTRICILASVDESDVGRIRVGQEATAIADAFPGERFAGRVSRIGSRGVNVSNVVTFEVRIEIQGENQSLLRPEMTANVQIRADERSGVLLVPAKAVIRKGDGQAVRVRGKDGGVEERAVETGVTDGTSLEIRKGVSEGEMVLVDGDGPGRPRPPKKKFWSLSS